MSGSFVLDWLVLAVSLFNTILLIWLGLTVLLNAERRTWGLWLSGVSLLMGGAFFLSHSAILGFGLDYLKHAANFWWYLGWIPVIVAPFAWYTIMLWYTGFWEGQRNPVYLRHRVWFFLLAFGGIAMLGMFVFARPLPSFFQITHFDLSATPSLWGAPVLLLLYPPYFLANIGLALDALLRPGPTIRVMGHLARQRARPWLAAASLALLLVSLLVGGIIFWVVSSARRYAYSPYLGWDIAAADLLISLIIAGSVVLSGQAMVSYEVFTGKALPRRGLLRYWHRAVILALGYSGTVSLALILEVHPIYSVLLSTGLLALFYALLSWRSYVERELFIERLRPFVASQQLFERLLASGQPSEQQSGADSAALTTRQPFHALCEDVLGARLAYLIPSGSLSPLFGPPLAFPGGEPPPLAQVPDIVAQCHPQTLTVPLDAAVCGGATWAVPLWNERGLCGLLLLGEKKDGGLYTQEEIEIARSAGERLMDMQAGAEMARRLMGLQRQRLAESQVLDRRTRRVLHDDILPRLHAAMLSLSSADPAGELAETVNLMGEVHRQIANLLRELPAATTPEVARLGLAGALRQVVEGELNGAFDQVTWEVAPEAEHKADHLPHLAAEVLFYAAREAIRNAARHARPVPSDGPLHLRIAVSWQEGLEVRIEDNGIGMEQSAASQGGSGQGLALHSTLLAVVGGSLSVESISGASTCICLNLPVS
ncbi:MAG: ATP-binding protein [Chloroflexota bacterium]